MLQSRTCYTELRCALNTFDGGLSTLLLSWKIRLCLNLQFLIRKWLFASLESTLRSPLAGWGGVRSVTLGDSVWTDKQKDRLIAATPPFNLLFLLIKLSFWILLKEEEPERRAYSWIVVRHFSENLVLLKFSWQILWNWQRPDTLPTATPFQNQNTPYGCKQAAGNIPVCQTQTKN